MAYIDNLRTFVRVYDLRNMSAAARDLRISPAVASARISQLEDHLGVRLFQRTTRLLHPTEQGSIFYDGATRVLEALSDAEAQVHDVTQSPRGTLYFAAPLWLGRRIIAPAVPAFNAAYPLIDLRLRLSDRKVDITAEGLDLAFFLGTPEDSTLKMRKIATVQRVLCASPDYIRTKGQPESPIDLTSGAHDCLNLRFPGAREFQWPLQTENGPRRFAVRGPFESDDGDVLTDWALAGHGIIMKPVFELADHLAAGRLVPVLPDTPPVDIELACLYAHRRKQDPKIRLFIDFMADMIQSALHKSNR
jgi:DNA-binding transcriptional LysR family regulator